MRKVRWRAVVSSVLGCFLALVGAPAASEIVQGAPILTVRPVDAIPAIDNPTYVSVAEAERFMRPDEPVLGLSDGTTAKVYSAWQLNHHEIVNDTIGNRPVAVTW